MLPENTSGSLKQELKAPNSNTVSPRSEGIQTPTGSEYGRRLSPETSLNAPQMSIFGVTTSSRESFKTISNQLLLFAQSKSSGELQVQVKVTVLGTRRDYMLTVKIPEPNGGVVTEVSTINPGQTNVVLDEFRGDIAISHILRWLDRYPVSVETKGGSVPLAANAIWITSNLDPRQWYPDLDSGTLDALMRRLEVTHFSVPYQ
jgi:hypothetical protein